MKKALISGITGQDGSYLTEFLIEKGYEVHGIVRPASVFNRERIDHIYLNSEYEGQKIKLHYGDLADSSCLNRIIDKIEPDEIYNLGAQSHVKRSFEIPEYTAETNAVGTLRLLDAIKDRNFKTKFYQASTSELFGNATKLPQSETAPFAPCSPYAASKLFAYWVTKNYREAYNIFGCNGILFNHESPRRGESFVTRKITLSAARIKAGIQEKLLLGNLSAKRDWGFAGDYVEAMWLIVQKEKPDDYVIATGESHSVKEFCEHAFGFAGFNIEWEGEGLNEKGIDKESGRTIIEVDSQYFRPTDVESLLGDISKAKKELNWEPKVKFKELVCMMVEHDIEYIQNSNVNIY